MQESRKGFFKIKKTGFGVPPPFLINCGLLLRIQDKEVHFYIVQSLIVKLASTKYFKLHQLFKVTLIKLKTELLFILLHFFPLQFFFALWLRMLIIEFVFGN